MVIMTTRRCGVAYDTETNLIDHDLFFISAKHG
jgi:hypothetical protein